MMLETITPNKQEVVAEKLYEIPSCSICLNDLSEEISSLACGHCFHLHCIMQSLEYGGQCPNCRKRAGKQEIRDMHFPLIQNSKANSQLRELLSSLNVSEHKQVEQLLREIRKEMECSQKLRTRVGELQRQAGGQSITIDGLRKELCMSRREGDTLRGENLLLVRKVRELQKMLLQNDQVKAKMQLQLQNYEKQVLELQRYRQCKKRACDGAQELVQKLQSMKASNTSYEERADYFYHTALMKILEILKLRDKVKEYPSTLAEKDNDITRLKMQIDQIRKEKKELQEKRNGERHRYNVLKQKHQNLVEKVRESDMAVELGEMDDSQGFNSVSNFKANNNVNNRSAEVVKQKQPVSRQTFLQMGNVPMRKPVFSQGNTIGGFKKKGSVF